MQKQKSEVGNWKTARSKLKRRSSLNTFLGLRGSSAKPVTPDFDLEEIIKILKEKDMDTNMPSIVFFSRKYLSGVFSILILSFVGTLTSALSATLCSERDGVLYLNNDPTVECSFATDTYRNLFVM